MKQGSFIKPHYKLAGYNQQIKFHYLQPQYPLACRLTIDLLEAVPLCQTAWSRWQEQVSRMVYFL